jgi:error-prone DNA polymerase
LLELAAVPQGEEVVFDYASMDLTLRSHLPALLRTRLGERRLLTAAETKDLPKGPGWRGSVAS